MYPFPFGNAKLTDPHIVMRAIITLTFTCIVFLTITLIGCGGEEGHKVTTFYEDGTTLKEEYFTATEVGPTDPEVRDGAYKAYYQSGKLQEEKTYVDGALDGTRTAYFEDGTIDIQETYKAGDFDGPYLANYPDGKTKEQGQFLDNAMSGEWKYYYETGELKEIVNFSGGMENGPYERYHTNGQLAAKGQYKDELETGHWVYYYPNGAKEEEVDYIEGKEDGLVVVLSETGDTLKRIMYSAGRPTQYEEYQPGEKPAVQ